MKEKILAFIPARGGSKGVKNKNIKLMNGKPLIEYTIQSAIKSDLFEDIIVSTDSIDIANISKKLGASVPFIRPDELSTDNAITIDAIEHCINYMKDKFNKKYDLIIVLQPTSPLRTYNNIVDAYNLYKKKKADFVVSVCECDHSPLWCNTLDNSLCLENFISEDIKHTRRQDLPIYYRINGAIYIGKVSKVLEKRGFYGSKSYAYIMDRESSVDIDNHLDFLIAESIMNFNKYNLD